MLNLDDRLITETAAKIKPNALSTLLAIAIHLNNKTGRAFPSNDRLQKLTGLGRDAVIASLAVLRKNKLLESYQVPGNGGKFGRREFRVTTKFISIFIHAEDAEPLPENPYTVDPSTVEPHTENTGTELINEKGNRLGNKELINQKEQTAGNFPQQPNDFPVEDQKNKNSPSIGAGPLRVTIIEGHEEILPPVKTKKARLPKEPSDGVIQKMVQVFEEEHKKYFQDADGDWIGFRWKPKEFPALSSIRKELEIRYLKKMHTEATAEDIIDSWRLFLQKAAECDKFTVDNWFTPFKIWDHFQPILQKIYRNKTSSAPSPKKSGSPNGFGGDMSKYAETQKF